MQLSSSDFWKLPWDQLLILSPSHAQLLADAGWSKKEIRDFVHEKACISLAEAGEAGMAPVQPELRQRLAAVNDRSMLVPITEKPEDLVIVVAGSPGVDVSTFVPGIHRKRIGEIDKYKPANWQELIKAASDELMR